MKKVYVIGAGPAGLTAAYELLRQDKNKEYKVTVLEESGAMGGISKTVNYKGNRMDMGGHRFFSKVPEVNAWWNNMLPLQGAPTYDDIVLHREMTLTPGGPDPEKEDRAMLVSSHIAGDLESLCDDIYMINDGHIIFHEETDALIGDYALLKMTREQYRKLDKSHVLRFREENYGYSCLTDQKAFYMDNYPDVMVENNGIDTLITMMIRGERV